MIYFMYYFIIHHFDCITQSIFYLTNSNETSADEQEDKENIGKLEQGKIKAKTDKDGTDHHDHGKPKEKPQNQNIFL